jgi:hypothetical protein
MVRKTLTLAGLLALAGLIGCGGMNTVEGEVTLDGTPVSGATVTFIPQDPNGLAGSAITDSSGRFTVTAGGTKKGLPAGTYKVTVVKSQAADAGGPDKMKGDGKSYTGGDYLKMMGKTNKPGGPPGGGAGGPPMPGPPGGAAGGGSPVKSELPGKYSAEKTTPFSVKVPLETKPLKLELSSK